MNNLSIIDLGDTRPPQYRYALGTVEDHPVDNMRRWVRIYAQATIVNYHAHLPRIGTESVDDIIEVRESDDITGAV